MTRRTRLLLVIAATCVVSTVPIALPLPRGLGFPLMLLALFIGATYDREMLAWIDAGTDDPDDGPLDGGEGW